MFDKMEVVTNVMHKDQHSLHTHLLLKLPKNKTFDNLLKGEIQEQGLETGRNIYKSIQNFFNNTVREKLKALNIMLEEHTTGKKYTSLKKYKEVNPISQVAEILQGFNRNDNSALESIRKTFTPKQTPERIERDRLEKIKKEQGIGAYFSAKNESKEETKTKTKKFGKSR